MKPQFKLEEIYIDLSKLSEEQINNLRLEDSDFLEFSDIELFRMQNPEYMILSFNHGKFNISHKDWFLLNDKTEITYSQFLDMMGETIGEKPKDILFDTWVNLFVGEKQANSEKERINSDGTLYIGEGLENYYKDQLERTGKFKVVAIDATSEEVLKVENNGWISVDKDLPNNLETIFISNGKGWTSIGCLVGFDDGYHWAESNGVIYEENGKIVAECESDDLDVKKWHPLPLPPKY